MLEAPIYQMSAVGVGGSYSIGDPNIKKDI